MVHVFQSVFVYAHGNFIYEDRSQWSQAMAHYSKWDIYIAFINCFTQQTSLMSPIDAVFKFRRAKDSS